MKTTTFSAFKAIATVALICIIGLNKSKAQNGPAPGTTYTIQNNTTCTYIVDVEEKDASIGCPTLFTHTGVTINPGLNVIMISTSCIPPLLCDIVITITAIPGCAPVPAGQTVSFSGSQSVTGNCGPNSANTVCNYTLNWGQFGSVIF